MIVFLLLFCAKQSQANDFPSLLVANATMGKSTFLYFVRTLFCNEENLHQRFVRCNIGPRLSW